MKPTENELLELLAMIKGLSRAVPEFDLLTYSRRVSLIEAWTIQRVPELRKQTYTAYQNEFEHLDTLKAH